MNLKNLLKLIIILMFFNGGYLLGSHFNKNKTVTVYVMDEIQRCVDEGGEMSLYYNDLRENDYYEFECVIPEKTHFEFKLYP